MEGNTAIGGANICTGFNNIAIGYASPPPEIHFGTPGMIYTKIQLGHIDVLRMQDEIIALRNEVDFLKSALHRVLAEESLREVELIYTEGMTHV